MKTRKVMIELIAAQRMEERKVIIAIIFGFVMGRETNKQAT
jgi:hypothetical protein